MYCPNRHSGTSCQSSFLRASDATFSRPHRAIGRSTAHARKINVSVSAFYRHCDVSTRIQASLFGWQLRKLVRRRVAELIYPSARIVKDGLAALYCSGVPLPTLVAILFPPSRDWTCNTGPRY